MNKLKKIIKKIKCHIECYFCCFIKKQNTKTNINLEIKNIRISYV